MSKQEDKIMGFMEKWRPSRELDRFRSEFDDVLERLGWNQEWFDLLPFNSERFGLRESVSARPAIESCVEEGKFIVRTDLPGIDPKDVDIKVAGDFLRIKGSREDKRETKKADFFRREIRYGSFERAISLPEGINAEDLKATYHDGVLELTAPMPKEAVPKEIKIHVEGANGATEKKAEAA
jgi:HSP20 family protein